MSTLNIISYKYPPPPPHTHTFSLHQTHHLSSSVSDCINSPLYPSHTSIHRHIMVQYTPLLFCIFLYTVGGVLALNSEFTCEPITIPFCMGDEVFTPWYNNTKLPNRYGQTNQSQIMEDMKEYQPIIDSTCSFMFR